MSEINDLMVIENDHGVIDFERLMLDLDHFDDHYSIFTKSKMIKIDN